MVRNQFKTTSWAQGFVCKCIPPKLRFFLLSFFLFVCLRRIINEMYPKDWDVTEHAKCLQLIPTWGLTIGIWCCLGDHAPLTPINRHVNKRHQYLTRRSLSLLVELSYWFVHFHFNSSISYKKKQNSQGIDPGWGWLMSEGINLFLLVFGGC